MQWWTWFVLGTLLLAIELFAIDAQFFLIFIGAAAIVVGLIGMLGIDFTVTDPPGLVARLRELADRYRRATT